VWDVTASDEGEFIAAAVDLGWRIPRGFLDLQKNLPVDMYHFCRGEPVKVG
jgi:hypothetical protein